MYPTLLITKLETYSNAKAFRSELLTNRQRYHLIYHHVNDRTVPPPRTVYASERMLYTRLPTTNVMQLSNIGSTIRNVHDRINGHLSKLASSVFKHLAICDNNTCTAISVNIIARDTDPVNLRLKEALYMNKEKPQINSREECNELSLLLF